MSEDAGKSEIIPPPTGNSKSPERLSRIRDSNGHADKPTRQHDIVALYEQGSEFEWDAELDFHPAANQLPLMLDADRKQLDISLAQNGQQDAIVLFTDKIDSDAVLSILDGRNRYLSLKTAGVLPRFKILSAKDLRGLTPIAWVLAQNVDRREYKEGQRALIVLSHEAELAAQAKKRMKAGKATDPLVDTSMGSAGTTRLHLARIAKVSESTIKNAKNLRGSGHDALIKAVFDGWLKLETAMRLLRLGLSQKQIDALVTGDPQKCHVAIRETLAPKRHASSGPSNAKLKVAKQVRGKFPGAALLCKKLDALYETKRDLESFPEHFGSIPEPANCDEIISSLYSSIASLEDTCPLESCDECKGMDSQSCKKCCGRGWLSVAQSKRNNGNSSRAEKRSSRTK